MIINTNSQREEDQTITYIRTLTNQLQINSNRINQTDSLAFSHSETDSFKFDLIVQQEKKKKRKKKSLSPHYKSPYKQSSLSIQKIMKSKGKTPVTILPFKNLIIQDSFQQEPKKKNPVNLASPKYLQIPPLIERLERNEADKMKKEARMIYEKRQKQGGLLSSHQKNQKWADFLLRQRRWQAQKNYKMAQARQKIIERERQNMNGFKPNSAPKIDLQEHIKSVKRKKLKLEQQLRQVSPNYFSWYSPRSPLPSMKRLSLVSKQKNPLKDRIVHVQSKREVDFLITK